MHEPAWLCDSDHAPVWASYRLPLTQVKSRSDWQCAERKLKLAIDRRDETTVTAIQEEVLRWLANHPLDPSLATTSTPPAQDIDAASSPLPTSPPPFDWTIPAAPPQCGTPRPPRPLRAPTPPPTCCGADLPATNNRLEEMQSALRQIAVELLTTKKKSPSPGRYFFGAFPAPLRLVKVHLHSLVRIRRFLHQASRRLPPSSTQVLTGKLLRRYHTILRPWKDQRPILLDKFSEDERAANPTDGGTGRDVHWWAHPAPIHTLQSALDQDMAWLNRCTKRKHRHLLSVKIKDSIRARELKITSNRLKSVFESLLGKQRSHYLYDTLQDGPDGSLLTDPVDIHRYFQQHYASFYSVKETSINRELGLDLPDLASAPLWESFLTDPRIMVQTFMGSAIPIPEELVNAVATAFQPPPTAHLVEEAITRSLENPFTFEEFMAALKRGGDTAAGASHTTYRMLQVAPEPFLREIFGHLNSFWDAGATPDQWKVVLLNLIHKKVDGPDLPSNFRPIGLIEVQRKVWTKMIMDRIIPIILEHEVLQPNHFGFLQAGAHPARSSNCSTCWRRSWSTTSRWISSPRTSQAHLTPPNEPRSGPAGDGSASRPP